jgi:NADH-quinone oxidoreductase subunit H
MTHTNFHAASRGVPIVWAAFLALLFPLLAAYIALIEQGMNAASAADRSLTKLYGRLRSLGSGAKVLVRPEQEPPGMDSWAFWFAPFFGFAFATAAYACLPFGPSIEVTDCGTGLLFVLAVTSVLICSFAFGAWSLREPAPQMVAGAAAQVAGYMLAAGLALVSVLILGGSLSMHTLVEAQDQTGNWFAFLSPGGFLIYFVASALVTDRAPFDVQSLQAKIATGDLRGYGGLRSTLYLLSEYTYTIVLAAVGVIAFLGGWLRPYASFHDRFFGSSVELLDVLPVLLLFMAAAYAYYHALQSESEGSKRTFTYIAALSLSVGVVLAASLKVLSTMPAVHGLFWFLIKLLVYLYGFLWLRATLRRYTFGQLMRLGWRFLVPLALTNVLMVAAAQLLRSQYGWIAIASFGAASLVVAVVGVLLGAAAYHEQEGSAPIPGLE